jgi:hypothetical protein
MFDHSDNAAYIEVKGRQKSCASRRPLLWAFDIAGNKGVRVA